MDITGPGGFRVTDAEVAFRAGARLRGLMRRDPVPLLVRTSSVHGFWLRGPLWLVGIAADLTVVTVEPLRRRQVARMPGARWILELPSDFALPRPGDQLAFRASGGEAEVHGGTPLPLRHPDRQPR